MTIVNFPDAAMKYIIQECLYLCFAIPIGTPITTGMCAYIPSLPPAIGGRTPDYTGRGVKDLTGCEHLVNLHSLDLNTNLVEDLTPLAGLPLDSLLDMRNNCISDVSALAGKTISDVYLQHNRIIDISALETLNYGALGIDDNYVVDLKPLVDNAESHPAALNVRGNPLNEISYNTYIGLIQAKGITVYYTSDYIPPTVAETNPVGAMYGGDFEGYLTVLNDDYIVQTLEVTDTVSNIFGTLLDYCWAHEAGTLLLGGVDAVLDVTLSLTFGNKSIMKCFQQVLEVVGGYLSCRPDPNNPALRYIYLEVLKVNTGKEVRLGKNIQSIEVSADMSKLCTRIVPVGDGTGVDQLNLSMLSPVDEVATHLTPDASFGYIKLGTVAAGTEFRCYKDWTADGAALPYHVTVKKDTVNDTSNWLQGSDPRQLKCAIGVYDAGAVYTVSYQHDYYMIGDTAYEGPKYGRITQPYSIKSTTYPFVLALAARNELAVTQYPQVAYKISAIDLSQLTGREWERYDIGDEINTIVESLDIDVDVSVEGKKTNLLSPEDVEYTFANYPLSMVAIMADQAQRIQALEEEPLAGVSETVNYSAILDDGWGVRAFFFTIPESYVRCNSVALWCSQSADGTNPTVTYQVPSNVKITVDGSTILDGQAQSFSGLNIMPYLDKVNDSVLGVEHLITVEHSDGETHAVVVYLQVQALVFRRSIALF